MANLPVQIGASAALQQIADDPTKDGPHTQEHIASRTQADLIVASLVAAEIITPNNANAAIGVINKFPKLDSDNLIQEDNMRTVAFQFFEKGAKVNGVQQFNMNLTQLYAFLDQRYTVENPDGGTGGGGGQPIEGSALGTPFDASANFTDNGDIITSTDNQVAKAVYGLKMVAGTAARLMFVASNNDQSGKIEVSSGKTIPAGAGSYGKYFAVYKNYNQASVVKNEQESPDYTPVSTPNGGDVVLCIHRFMNNGVDTFTAEYSNDGGATWGVFDTLIGDGQDKFVKVSCDGSAQSIPHPTQTGCVNG